MTNSTDETKGYSATFWENLEKSRSAYTNLLKSFSSKLVLKASDYPDNYGGAYINRAGKLIVLIVQNVDASTADFKNRTASNEILFETCQYSYKTLKDTIGKINAFKLNNPDNPVAKNFPSCCIADKRNRIEVHLFELSQSQINAFKKEVTNEDCVEFMLAEEQPVDDINVNPGGSISSDTGGGSMGYRVRRSGNNGILTAGHVATSTSSGSNSIYSGGTAFAECTNRQQSGSVDAAFCRVTNSDYTATNNVGSNTLSTTIDELSVGDIVNMRGAASGTVSGEILNTSYSGTFSSIYFTDLVQTDYSRAGGDSGALVYAYYSSSETRTTLGTHKGGSSSYGYYVKANLINDALSTSRY